MTKRYFQAEWKKLKKTDLSDETAWPLEKRIWLHKLCQEFYWMGRENGYVKGAEEHQDKMIDI